MINSPQHPSPEVIQDRLKESADFIRSKTSLNPKLGIVLGSGLGSFVQQIKTDIVIPYNEIPSFTPPSVQGHGGELHIGTLSHKDGDLPIAALQGRIHYYEGYTMTEVAHAVRTLALLGTETLVLTNSSGGLDPNMKPGDFMIIDDHINLMGKNPLMGPNLKSMGPRFPDMTEAYEKKLRTQLVNAFKKNNIDFYHGAYCGVTGPTYETPAEIKFLQTIGGSAVGMSTVPESIAANHLGLRVCGLSCITNLASGLSDEKLSHEDVTKIALQVEDKFNKVLKSFIENLD